MQHPITKTKKVKTKVTHIKATVAQYPLPVYDIAVSSESA